MQIKNLAFYFNQKTGALRAATLRAINREGMFGGQNFPACKSTERTRGHTLWDFIVENLKRLCARHSQYQVIF